MGIEVVAKINGIEPSVAFAMGEEPTARGAAFTILLVVAVLWPHELRRQRQGQIASGRDDAGGEHRVMKLGHAIGAFARRTVATRQFSRTKVFRSVERDQHTPVKTGQGRQGAGSLHRCERLVEQSVEARGLDEIQHVTDVIVAGYGLHAKQRLAIGAPVPSPGAKLNLVRKKRRALHKNAENAAMPISAIVQCEFLPCRLSAKPAQVVRTLPSKSVKTVTQSLNQKSIQRDRPKPKKSRNLKMRIAAAGRRSLTCRRRGP